MDAGNLLKPMLARGELHCIGATTLDEYRKYIEKDPALERRFQPVLVDEPTVEDAISILRGLKERFEVHHGVRISDSAIVEQAPYTPKKGKSKSRAAKEAEMIWLSRSPPNSTSTSWGVTPALFRQVAAAV